MTVKAALLPLLTPLGPFALLAIMAVAFAETGLLAGFLLPADTLVVTADVLVPAGALQAPVWMSLAAVTAAAVAGVAGMNRRRFLAHNVVGAATRADVMFGGGYVFAAIPAVADHLDVALLLMVVVSTLPGAASFAAGPERQTLASHPRVGGPHPADGVRASDEPHGCRARAWPAQALIR